MEGATFACLAKLIFYVAALTGRSGAPVLPARGGGQFLEPEVLIQRFITILVGKKNSYIVVAGGVFRGCSLCLIFSGGELPSGCQR